MRYLGRGHNPGRPERRGRRRSGPAQNNPGVPASGSPFDFSAEETDQVDPVDLMAIRADDELLDALAAGRRAGPAFTSGIDDSWDSDYVDDQRVLALLADWRADVEAEPIPELISTDDAVAAVLAGRRVHRKRRLMPVAAAAAVFVVALGGVAAVADNAQPGDPLWGVSKVIDGNRAKSVEAAYQVDLALASAQRALAEGRVAEAKAKLAAVAPALSQVRDTQRKAELSEKSDNLQRIVASTPEGEQVRTDEKGHRRDHDRGGQGPGSTPSSGPTPSAPGSTPPSSEPTPPSSSPESGQDHPERNPGWPGHGTSPSQRPEPDSASPRPTSPAPPSNSAPPESTRPAPGNQGPGHSQPGSGGSSGGGSGNGHQHPGSGGPSNGGSGNGGAGGGQHNGGPGNGGRPAPDHQPGTRPTAGPPAIPTVPTTASKPASHSTDEHQAPGGGHGVQGPKDEGAKSGGSRSGGDSGGAGRGGKGRSEGKPDAAGGVVAPGPVARPGAAEIPPPMGGA